MVENKRNHGHEGREKLPEEKAGFGKHMGADGSHCSGNSMESMRGTLAKTSNNAGHRA